MRYKPLNSLFGAVASAIVALMLIGCNGKTGAAGQNGTPGTPGTPAPTTNALDATTLSTDEWSALSLTAKITKVSVTSGIPSVNFTLTDGHNVPIKGFAQFTSNPATAAYTSYPNLGFSIAKLIPSSSGSPSRWVNYIVTADPTAAAPTTWVPATPYTDNIGTLVDNGDGTYVYTFRRDISATKAQLDAATYTAPNVEADLDDVTYDPTLTHRITLFVGGFARGTGSVAAGDPFYYPPNTANGSDSGVKGVYPLNPANAVYDFIPSTGLPVTSANEQRLIADMSGCFSCHTKFEFHATRHQDVRYCVVCHNDQRKYGRAEAATTATGYSGDTSKIGGHATGDFPRFIHRLHMGEELTKTGYNYVGVKFNEVTYPQDHRNCTKCHTASPATPQGDNWFNKPNRFACGACHDKVDFATGLNHGPAALVQTSDAACAGCHDAADIKTNHIAVVPPNPNNLWNMPGFTGDPYTNASYVVGSSDNLPPGADKVTWDLKDFKLDSTGHPIFKFRFLRNGAAVVFNTYSATTTEMMNDFVGSPGLYVAFSVPQDGIATPADWNASSASAFNYPISTYLKSVWDGTATGLQAGSLSATPDASGYYTLTMTGVTVPSNASMITGGIGYIYALYGTPPLTQTNVPGYPYTNPDTVASLARPKNQGGLAVPAPNVSKLASSVPAGFPAQTARRAIVASANCNNCHGALGTFTDRAFHAGQRNDAATCAFCHSPNLADGGWGVNAKDFIHSIHGSGKRANKYAATFSWSGTKFWNVTYPGILNNCEACHLPGTYDFGRASNAAAVPNLLWTTVASDSIPSVPTVSTVGVVTTGSEVSDPVNVEWWSREAYDIARAALGAPVPNGYNFGAAFGYDFATQAITQAAGTTLVNSPYVAACSGCHDTPSAINHMKTNGGSYYATRASVQSAGAFVKQEQCFLCHSAGKVADTEKVHMNFK